MIPNVVYCLIKLEKSLNGRNFRIVVMVSLKPIERMVRYQFRLEFPGQREGKGRAKSILAV